jgi:hypothetical protein
LIDNVGKLQTGQIYKLNIPFSKEEIPKGFEQQIISQNKIQYFMTQQRISLLDEAVQFSKCSSSAPNGLVLAGPHGIGKSAVRYFTFRFDLSILNFFFRKLF